MNYKVTFTLFSFLLLLLTSCEDDSDVLGIEGINNIKGTVNVEDQEFNFMGGLVEYNMPETPNTGSYHTIKISSLPVHLIRDKVQAYVSSQEKVNILFSVESGNQDNVVQAGTYQFTEYDYEDENFPSGLVFFHPQLILGETTASTASSTDLGVMAGKIIISGDYPDLVIEGEFTLDNKQISTFYAEGTFVTQDNYTTFEIISM